MLEDWKGAHRFLCTERILTHQRTFPGGSELITLLSLRSTPLVCLSPENSRLTIIAHWTLTKTSSTAFNSHALWKNHVVTFLYLSLLRKNSHHTSPFFNLCLFVLTPPALVQPYLTCPPGVLSAPPCPHTCGSSLISPDLLPDFPEDPLLWLPFIRPWTWPRWLPLDTSPPPW